MRDWPAIMHKINSYIAVISGYTQMLQQKTPADFEELRKWEDKIARVCLEFEQYVRNLPGEESADVVLEAEASEVDA
jgi:hypothetical protein